MKFLIGIFFLSLSSAWAQTVPKGLYARVKVPQLESVTLFEGEEEGPRVQAVLSAPAFTVNRRPAVVSYQPTFQTLSIITRGDRLRVRHLQLRYSRKGVRSLDHSSILLSDEKGRLVGRMKPDSKDLKKVEFILPAGWIEEGCRMALGPIRSLEVKVKGNASTVDPSKLWTNGKITPEQPFEARVVGVVSSWGGAIVLLKEKGGKGRYCVASLMMHMFQYSIVEAKNFDREEWGEKGAIFVDPLVEIQNFSWSMGVHKIGRIFGEQDFVRTYYKSSKPKIEEKAADGKVAK